MLEETNQDWFAVKQTANFPSPSLLVFPDRIATNIQHLLQIAGSPECLWPHVKTYKMPQIVEMHLAAGIRRFKCATISEAEMLGRCGVDEVLLAYQPVGPNIQRLAKMVRHFPQVSFATLVDDLSVLQQLQTVFSEQKLPLAVFLDIDNGMGRTGIVPGEVAHQLYRQMHEASGLEVGGLHVYDGHFRQSDFAARKAASDAAFVAITDFQQKLEAAGLTVPTVIAGGSPTFPVHALRKGVSLSPGTYPLWDAGYAEMCPELPFQPAAVLLTRVISKPGNNRLCLDLGHKAVAAENPLTHRVRFLNADIKGYLGQSEEHLIVEVEDPTAYPIGMELFAIPWHICPTVALHEQVKVIREGELTERWWVEARCRRLRF